MTPEEQYPSEAHRRIEPATYIDSAEEGGPSLEWPQSFSPGITEWEDPEPTELRRPDTVKELAPAAIHDFVERAQMHAYKWTNVGRPLPLC